MQKKETIIGNTQSFVKETLKGVEGGHDWWHIYRVWNNAKLIAKSEDADMFIVEMGALLHDIAEAKFHGGDEEIGPKVAQEFMESQEIPKEDIDKVLYIIRNISFKNTLENNVPAEKPLELEIVQDADRLDALGAIGIARCFNYRGYIGRELYNPDVPPIIHTNKEQYKKADGPSLNHFYEKLLRLKDMMNTKTGRTIAEERSAYMEGFVKQFLKEWN